MNRGVLSYITLRLFTIMNYPYRRMSIFLTYPPKKKSTVKGGNIFCNLVSAVLCGVPWCACSCLCGNAIVAVVTCAVMSLV